MTAPHTDLRLQLRRGGFSPIPCEGKRPALKAWEQMISPTFEQIEYWEKIYNLAENTGVLTQRTPALDVDIADPTAAEAVETLAREWFEERGETFLVRVGEAPKRAIILQTDAPFSKQVRNIIAPNGAEYKIELLAMGQQIVVSGIHPKTGQPYTWHGGELAQTVIEDLPYINLDIATRFLDAAVKMLVEQFEYRAAGERPKDDGDGANPADWGYLIDNIHVGRELHDSTLSLAAKLLVSGMSDGAAVNFLRGLYDKSLTTKDERFQERRDDIPRAVKSARRKLERAKEPKPDDDKPKPIGPKPSEIITPCTIEETLTVFDKWLLLEDQTPVITILGTIAANLLPGDPVWLGIIAPPSSAKTEILNSVSRLPNIVPVATLTPAGLLSGTSKKQHDVKAGAKGGLLRQIGEFGIIVLKDFGSVLSMRPDAKAETIAALREVYDGSWTRVLGTDGGRSLHWSGKIGLVFGATGVIDSHHGVIGAMGDRFLFSRLAPLSRGQFSHALKHVGPATKQMRKELAEAVARLFAGRRAEPQTISDDEIRQIDAAISLAVRLRGAVERDRHSREMESVLGAEGTARIGLSLERLLAGLDTIGVPRDTAIAIVKTVALDSVPPLRLRAYNHLRSARRRGDFLDTGDFVDVDTSTVAQALGLPTNTVRRLLEDLAAYGLVERHGKGTGKADKWIARQWENDP